jgi:hypothetical protein
MQAALSEDLTWILFASIGTTTGPIYLWTGMGSVVWNSQTWLGMGEFCNITSVPESCDISANGIKLALSGVPSSMILDAYTALQQGLPATLYLGAMDLDGNIIVDPFPCFMGRTDAVDIVDGGETSTVTLGCESRMIDLQNPRFRDYEDACQQQYYPGDTGFRYVPAIADINLVWGAPGGVGVPTLINGGGVGGPPGTNGGGTPVTPALPVN